MFVILNDGMPILLRIECLSTVPTMSVLTPLLLVFSVKFSIIHIIIIQNRSVTNRD